MPDRNFARGPHGELQRPAFAEGEPFTACDLDLEQDYCLQLVRHHLRFAHGWGVVCGLRVVAVPDPALPWLIRVCPGYGISPCGDELVVPSAANEDLRDWLWTRPLQTPANLAVPIPMAWIALRPITRTSHPVPAPSKGCACEEPDYKPSRICDWYRIVVLWTLPQFPPLRGDICSGKTESPPCPDTCDLVLAGIRLPKANDPLTDNAIDNWTWRKLLFS